jgi:hypothetical protein
MRAYLKSLLTDEPLPFAQNDLWRLLIHAIRAYE